MSASEGAIRRSLQARRGVVAEILAALQRMGRRPPPAVLVSPEDVLAVIRTSMLLGGRGAGTARARSIRWRPTSQRWCACAA